MNSRKNLITTFVLLTLGMVTAFGASAPVVELQMNHVFALYDGGDSITTTYGMGGNSLISIKSPNEGNVRGDVAASVLYNGGMYTLSLDRAYLRARFPQFRLTAGKTRVSWGDGSLFNAADLLFGSTDVGIILTGDELRTSTEWLTSVQVPLGPFSFIEAVIIPPVSGSIEETQIGGRVYTTVGLLKIEAGGAYHADTSLLHASGKVLSPYIALQGNIGPDWYAATSVNIAYPVEQISDELEDSWVLSAGLLHILSVGWQGTLSLRLEALVRPFGKWAPSASASATGAYGLYLYPELSYAPNDSMNFLLRSIISPIDVSTTIIVGGTWNVMQGFSLNGFLNSSFGEEQDTFSWVTTSPTPSTALSIGASWVY